MKGLFLNAHQRGFDAIAVESGFGFVGIVFFVKRAESNAVHHTARLLAFADAPPVTVGLGTVQLTVPAGCEPGRAAVVGVLRLLLDEACDAWTGSLARTVDVCIVGGRPADRRAGWAAVSETAGHIEMLTATITRLVLPAEVLNPARPTTRP